MTKIPIGQPGECRLILSGSSLLLSPYNGNRIVINDTLYAIPSTGITLAATGATANTTYYIYIYDNAGTLTLELSTTGHATDANNGIEIRSGDATRTLVGMARAISGPAWVDSEAQRFVLSWFNRRKVISQTTGGTDAYSTTATSPTELNSALKCEFLVWANNLALCALSWGYYCDTVNVNFVGALAINSTTSDTVRRFSNLANASQRIGHGIIYGASGLSEGYNYTTMLVWVGTGATGIYGNIVNVVEVEG